MVAQAAFICLMLAIFATSMVAGVAGAARARSAGEAKAMIAPGIETVLGAYERDIASAIAAQAGFVQGTLVTAPALVAALHDAGAWGERHYLEAPDGASSLRVAVDVVPTTMSVPSCSGGGSGSDLAVDLQCSPFVQESRLSLTLTSDAGPVDVRGAVSALAHGRYTVTLRLFAQPPYVMVSGVNDAADPAAAHEGDVAGFGNALSAFASPSPDDTTIHVVYACTPGTGACANSNPVPADAPITLPWTNGNGTSALP